MPDIENTNAPVEPVEQAPAAPGADATPEWDGSDWGQLDTYDWWKNVPEGARKHLSQANIDRKEAKERSDFLDRLFRADDDKLREEYDTTVKERDELRKERDSLKEALSGIEARQAQEESDREYERLSSKYPDIFADYSVDEKGDLVQRGAYVKFVKLLSSGESEEDAAAMARAVLTKKDAAAAPATQAAPAPEKPKTREVEAPPSIRHAGKGGNNPSNTVSAKELHESLDQRAARLEKQYREEEERAARGGA